MERSLAVGDRLGGHYVTGHVDSLGILIDRPEDPPWAHLRFQLPVNLHPKSRVKEALRSME